MTRARCYVFRGTSQLLSTLTQSCCVLLQLLVCYMDASDELFARARSNRAAANPLSQPIKKTQRTHRVTGANFGVSEAPAQKLHKSATPTDPSEAPATAADKPSSHLVGPVTSAAKAAVGAQKQKCREYDCSHSCSARRASA